MTYFSSQSLTIGSVVSVPLKTTLKDAVVIEEVKKPEFETAEIVSVSNKFYTNEQMEIAKFISEYYFSSFGEAISLFLPYPMDNGQPQGIAPTLSDIQQKAYDQLLKKDKALLFGVFSFPSSRWECLL